MNIEIFQLLGIVCASVGVAFTATKIFIDISISKKSQKREEYKFAKDFLLSLKEDKNQPCFLKEKGFQAILGDNKILPEVANAILKNKNSTKAIALYKKGRIYIVYNDKKQNFILKGKYNRPAHFYFRISLSCLAYLVFSVLSFLPFVYPLENQSAAIFFKIVFLVTFLPFAMGCASHAKSVLSASRFLNQLEES